MFLSFIQILLDVMEDWEVLIPIVQPGLLDLPLLLLLRQVLVAELHDTFVPAHQYKVNNFPPQSELGYDWL